MCSIQFVRLLIFILFSYCLCFTYEFCDLVDTLDSIIERHYECYHTDLSQSITIANLQSHLCSFPCYTGHLCVFFFVVKRSSLYIIFVFILLLLQFLAFILVTIYIYWSLLLIISDSIGTILIVFLTLLCSIALSSSQWILYK